jgi:hypothetical protein
MKPTLHLAVATALVSMLGAAHYGCSGSDGSSAKIEDVADAATRPATPAGGEAGVERPPVSDSGAVDAAPQPKTCAVLEGDGGSGVVIEPAACRACAAAKCCAELTACYAGPPAGPTTGTKTSCVLFGECENACAGDGTCEDKCSATHGESAATQWAAIDACLTGPASGCMPLCQ